MEERTPPIRVETHFNNIIANTEVKNYIAILDAFSACFPAFSYEVTDNVPLSESAAPRFLDCKDYRRLYVSVSICDLSPFVVQEVERAYHTMSRINPLVSFVKQGFCLVHSEVQNHQE